MIIPELLKIYEDNVDDIYGLPIFDKFHWKNLCDKYLTDTGVMSKKSEDMRDTLIDFFKTHKPKFPYRQFDLSAFEDSIFCVKGFNSDVIGSNASFNTWDDCVDYESEQSTPDYTTCCNGDLIRGASISGNDPYSPWYNLGNDTGLNDLLECEVSEFGQETCLYTFVDQNVIDGFEYTYSVTSYDMGVSGSSQVLNDDGTLSTTYIANPDEWANPKGYQSIETSRGTTVYDPNFVIIVPGYKSTEGSEDGFR